MNPFGDLEGLRLAFDSGKRMSVVMTDTGSKLSDVLLEDTSSVSETVERLRGVDGAGVPVAFDIEYDSSSSDEVVGVLIRRGESLTEFGMLQMIKF